MGKFRPTIQVMADTNPFRGSSAFGANPTLTPGWTEWLYSRLFKTLSWPAYSESHPQWSTTSNYLQDGNLRKATRRRSGKPAAPPPKSCLRSTVDTVLRNSQWLTGHGTDFHPRFGSIAKELGTVTRKRNRDDLTVSPSSLVVDSSALISTNPVVAFCIAEI